MALESTTSIFEWSEYIWDVVQGIVHCSGCEGEKLKTIARCVRVSRRCYRHAHDGETEKAFRIQIRSLRAHKADNRLAVTENQVHNVNENYRANRYCEH